MAWDSGTSARFVLPAFAMRSWVSFRSAFIAMVAWSGGGLLGVHKVATFPSPAGHRPPSSIIIPVLLFYVLLSGYLGVVITDFLQALIIIGSSMILMILVLADFGGPGGLHEELLSKFGPAVLSWHPPQSHELLGLVGVIAWTVGTAVGNGGDVAPMAGAMEGQRLLSCKNAREASKMYIWTEGVLFVMLAVIALPALGAMVKWPGLYDGSINRELAYGMLLGEYLPQGLLGLAIVSILASIMSSISSNMNFGSQVFLSDIYRRSLVKHASLAHYMNVGRVVMLVIIGLVILVATKATNLIDISVFMLGLSSAEITANWGQWWWRFNGKARFAASFGGPLIFLFNHFVVFKRWIVVSSNADYYVVLCSMGMNCLLWVLVALLTKPDSKECLLAFYKAARPLGWWGPIAREADGKSPRRAIQPIFKGLLVAALGAAMIAAGTVCVSCLYVARWNTAAVAGASCLAVGWIFKRLYNQYLTALEQDVGLDHE